MKCLIAFLITIFTLNCYADSRTAVEYYNNAQYDLAEREFNLILKSSNYDTLIAKCYHYLGAINYQKSNFVKALSYFNKSYLAYEKLDSITKASGELCNIGLIYLEIGNLKKAKFYIRKSLDISISHENYKSINQIYTNLFVVESNLGNRGNAERYARVSIAWSVKYKDTLELAKGYSNLGTHLMENGRYDKARFYLQKSLSISEDSVNIAICYNNLGFISQKLRKFKEADYYFNQSISILRRTKSFNYLKDIYNNVHSFKYEIGDFKESLRYYKLFINVKDSLMNEDNHRAISRMITEYDNKFKTKERENYIQILELNKKNNKQKIFYLWIVLALTFLSIIVVAIGFHKNRKNYIQNKALSDELSRKNNDITDSIKYAQRLQNGILGDAKSFINNVNTSSNIKTSLYYSPKDIVSGDFYWSYNANGKLYIAIGDCTGHGVPGSMISVIGHSSLSKIMDEGYIKPVDILNKLDKMVKQYFKGDDDITDGIDLSLICISDSRIEFVGANNSIYIRRPEKIEVIRGDKSYIGSGKGSFKSTSIDLIGIDAIYMMTDGVFDQFGGPDFKKIKQNGLKSIILKSKKFSDIVSAINIWKGDKEQTDDITLLELKLK